ncbi:MAG TPA: SprB repeat-containing protein, partial [Chitinophagaceae bacterium]|nr:SprB repeat-containing protein [Chitinophagaceae bacterium]
IPNGTDANLPNPARNAESILNGSFSIGADNIVIKGFRFSSPGQAIISNNSDWKNSTIENNLIDVNTTGSPAVLFRGASMNPIQSSGHSIINNRFVRTTGGNGGMLVLSKCADIIVRGNSFIQTGATLRSFNAMVIENTVVENVLIESNYFRDVVRAMQILSGKNLTIRQNKIEAVGRGIQLFYGWSPMQHINIDGNYIKDDKGTQPILLRRDNTDAGVEDINIQNNVIEQNVADYGGGGGMIELELSQTAVHGTINVLSNKITISGDYTTASAASNQGIFISGKHNLTNIRNNEINFTAFNWRVPEGSPYAYPPVPTGIYFMTDGGTDGPGRPFAGAISSTSEFNVENNIINGFKNSIAFYDPLSDTEGGLTAFKGYGKLTAGAKVFIQYNSFLNDEIAVNNGEESYDVSAQCNWWGVYKVQDMLSRFSLSTVSPLPWLIDGTDTDPSTTGFQPADGTCTGAAPVVVLDGSSNVTCNGAANGSAQITATGGFGPLQFKWTKEGDADFVSTDEDPSNFGPGTYHLAVTDNYGSSLYLDANGDLHAIDVTITEPDAISSTFNSTNIACYGNNNGSASIEASGGTGTLSYLWSNGETGNSVSGLPPGYISVDVTDENGCVISKSATITQPAAPLSVTMTGTSASCNGSVTATAGGGTAPYNYLWNNGATTSSISNVPAGTYDIIVTDANNCTTNGTLSITGNAT